MYNYFPFNSAGKEKEAREVLSQIRPDETKIEGEIQSYKDLNELFRNTNKIQALKERTVLVRLGIVLTLYATQIFCGKLFL